MPPLAAYDESVPYPPANPELAERFARLRELRPAVDPTRIREVVIVVSSSRGGCTLLGELLRRCPSLLALPAESNPYIVVAQLGAADPAATVAAELARVIGRPADDPDARAFALEWSWRLTAQWPRTHIEPHDVAGWVAEASPGAPGEVAAHVLGRARERDARLDPRRYDMPHGDGEHAAPVGPPGDLLVEMPPFVVPRPWRLATDDELERCPLVLATPRNAYRVAFFAGLFPHARLRVVHLVRNPAASINGLIDGWLHHGFFNCQVPLELSIRGYSDRFPWGRTWWKYDIPPEWEAFIDAPLAEVCAQQWRSTHQAALAAAAALGLERHVVRYEDLVGRPEQRHAVAQRLADHLGIAHGDLVPLVLGGLDPVMATAPPRPGRWRARERELADVIADERTLALAERLGYDTDPRTWG